MRRLVLLALLVAATAPVHAVEQDQEAPQFRGNDFSGNEVSFPSVIEGKPTVIIFWATWCPYCKAFMSYLGKIQKEYGVDRINIVAINARERGSGDPKAYVEALSYPVIGVARGCGRR